MKTSNNKVPITLNPIFAYIFFLVHAGVFSLSGFFIFYSAQMPLFGFLHGGLAIFVYLVFYSALFGKEAIKNMFIGAIIGIFQIFGWLEIIGSKFIGKDSAYKSFSSMPFYYHIIPGIYFILYTFLLRNAIYDLLGARKDPSRANIADWGFYILSGLIFILPNLFG